MMRSIVAITLFILCLVAVQPAFAQQGNGQVTNVAATTSKTLSEAEKINLLIESIGAMKGATFIRNGSEHTCQEAAAHLKAKYEKHGSKIKSADEFISYLATKSSVSGEVYKIRFADGHEEPTAEVLHHVLEQLK